MSIAFSSKVFSITASSDCLIVGVAEKTLAGSHGKAIDKAMGGQLSHAIKTGDLGKKPGDHLMVYAPTGIAAKRLLLIQLGAKTFTDRHFLTFADTLAQACLKLPVKQVNLLLENITVEDRDAIWQVRQITQAFIHNHYRYDHYKTEKSPVSPLTQVAFCTANKALLADCKRGTAIGKAIGAGMTTARDLGNCPPNICTPNYLSQQAKALASGHKNVTVKVQGEKAMEALGMHSLLSVGRGSAQPSQLITLEYKGGKKGAAPYALVGKGITFDSGGISLKSSAGMDEMKYDMCGAASVLGCLQAVVAMKLPINVIAVIAAAENMPSSTASRPGDIVTSLSGKTIEILNTDAEGRLVLCDALTYVQQQHKPKSIIDIATLTGACVVALGSHASGLYSNDDVLSQALVDAGRRSGDRAWPMPLWDDYTQQLKSQVADLGNIGGKGAGSVTAACFLAEFTKEALWAHLDIAGTAWLNGTHKDATGRPVGLLTEYLMAVS